MVHIEISQLQKIVHDAVNQVWEAIDRQRAVKQLAEQREEATRVLLRKEQEWEGRFEELQSRRSRRKSWFVRTFGCGSVEGLGGTQAPQAGVCRESCRLSLTLIG
ncbi:hypothetical protein NQZ68_032259 [Dissostichus eleginoides]|nr:hypothetical protein NQZ68_032259 [Dissostichus eleginoides]